MFSGFWGRCLGQASRDALLFLAAMVAKTGASHRVGRPITFVPRASEVELLRPAYGYYGKIILYTLRDLILFLTAALSRPQNVRRHILWSFCGSHKSQLMPFSVGTSDTEHSNSLCDR